MIVLAAHRVQSIGAVYFDGELAIRADGTPLGRWAGHVTVDKKLGHPGQTAFAGLMRDVSERLASVEGIYFDDTFIPDTVPDDFVTEAELYSH